VVFNVRGTLYPAHRVILCAQSPNFKRYSCVCACCVCCVVCECVCVRVRVRS
jgi:hypothetical protein